MSYTEEIDSGHLDRVTALHINYDGSRMLTASIDHRVKVWDIDTSSGDKTLVETFRAHDADIRDAKWFHPSTGSHLATVGNDLKCHIWQEDTYQAPNSGRRFRNICTIPSKPRVPFVSLDIRNTDNVYTVLALIDRQGLLSVYEPTNPDEFKDWTLVDQFNVCIPAPGRGEQTCFKVRFDQNVIPLPYINSVSDERRQLSLVVTAMNEVKIYRSIKNADAPPISESGIGMAGSHSLTPDTASRRYTFHEAARLPPHPALIRDVQWAPFNVRGFDLFATACRDGGVRIFEMAVSEGGSAGRHDSRTSPTASRSSLVTTSNNPSKTASSAATASRYQQPAQSSLTSAIIARGGVQQTASGNTNPTSDSTTSIHQQQPSTQSQTQQQQQPHPRTTHKFPYTTTITAAASLPAHDDAWSLAWDPSGQVLLSTGSDGVTKIWRKAVLDSSTLMESNQSSNSNSNVSSGGNNTGNGGDSGTRGGGGKWMLFADQAVDLGGSQGGSGGMGTEDEESEEGEGEE